MPSVQVTRVRLTALWLVLRTLRGLGGRAESSELILKAGRSGLRGGRLPIREGVSLAREGRFMQESAGVCALDPLGESALELCESDYPNSGVLRLFVTVLLLDTPPSWVAWWQGRPADFDEIIPSGEREVMEDAGLLPHPSPEDPRGWAWWHALGRVPHPERTAIERKHIGDAGERLSVDYERRRLTAQGHRKLADRVTWISQESDLYGFDVLSFVGDDAPGTAPEDPIAIEVKSTALPIAEAFPLYLTAHEWEVAQGLGHRARLHLWSSVDPGPPPRSQQPAPIVFATATLADHLPRPGVCGDSCTWQTARVMLRLPP